MTTKVEDSNTAPKTYLAILIASSAIKSSLLYHLYLQMIVLFQAIAKKANLFKKFLASVYTPIKNNSVLPPLLYKTNTRITSFLVSNKDILSIIYSLDSSRSHGYVIVSVRMLKNCKESVTIPFKILFQKSLKNEYFQRYGKKLMQFQYTNKKTKH